MPACYSNLNNYGTNEKDNPIVPPTPVDTAFEPFNRLRPHNYNSNASWSQMNDKVVKENFLLPNNLRAPPNCASNSFRAEFANDSQIRRENQFLNQGFFSQRFRQMSGF